MSKETKRLLIVLGTIISLIAVVGLLVFSHTQKQRGIYNEFLNKFNGKDNTLIYIGRPTCSYSSLLEPSLLEMKERYEFDYLYLNIDEVNNVVLSQILEDLNLTSIGTPYLAVVSNGKIVDTQNGYVDYDALFGFLQENKIISSTAELSLNYIDLKEYKTLLAEKENKVIVIGQSTCPYCVKAKLILNEVVDETDAEINYLNISNFTSEEDFTEFEKTLELLQSDKWGTPITMIVKEGKLVDYIEGVTTKEEYIKFLKLYEVIK